MKVTKMTQSKKVPDRWYIDFENGESLRVNVALIADFSLYSGRELTDSELEELRRAAGGMNAKARALRIIGSRSMSRNEMYRRLVEKGETERDAEAATEWLEKIGAINDEEYSCMLVRHYAAKGYGLGRIKNELYRRGIDKKFWDRAIEQRPDAADTMDRFISMKLKGREADKKEIKKVTDALFRRGFSWEEIKSAMARYEENTEEY